MDRGDDVCVGYADDDNIVRVVRHGGTERAAFQSEAADESDSDIASRPVPFDHDEFQDVAFDVGNNLPVENLGRLENFFRDDLMRDDFNHADFLRALSVHFEIRWRAIAQVHRAARLFRALSFRSKIFPVFGHECAFLVNAFDLELREIVEDDEVRPEPRRDRPMVPEAVIARRVDRPHLNRRDRRHAECDGFPNRMIDVPFVDQIARQLVVGGERAVG